MYSTDLGEAIVFLLGLPDTGFAALTQPEVAPLINVGVGHDITIRELATLIKSVVGYEGELAFDSSKPDGTPRKLLDVSRLHSLGWRAQTTLDVGVRTAYADFLQNSANHALG